MVRFSLVCGSLRGFKWKCPGGDWKFTSPFLGGFADSRVAS